MNIKGYKHFVVVKGVSAKEVLVGDPAFYGRFGFKQYPGVNCHGVPDENVLCLSLAGDIPAGEVTHHPAFSVEA